LSKITKVRKKDGSLVDFKPEKITQAIEKSLLDAKLSNGKAAKRHTQDVIKILEKSFDKTLIPTVQDVEDVVFEVLRKNKQQKAIDAFKAYKRKHKEALGFRTVMGVRDDVGLSTNAIVVLAKRYLLRNEAGNIVETPARLFRRVAKTIAQVERNYKKSAKKAEEEFYKVMANLEFLPNTPTLMNAGTELGQLSACFVLPVEDRLRSIFRTVENMAIIQQSGGGTGFSFTKLRPKGDIVKSTKGVASGPVSFMTVYDKTTDVIKQGGKRRGANMGILNADHPDIAEFIKCKAEQEILKNFNVSVGATDDFMDAVNENKEWWLVNPRTKKKVKKVSASIIFDLMCRSAWKSGDPGIVFLDEINRHNPTPEFGPIESTNPCGEQPLLPYESCNLGSINLAKMVSKKKVEWAKLKRTIRTAVHMLDNVIDANKYPIEQIKEMTLANRKIGLGVMGFAEMLAQVGIPYNSDKAVEFAEKLMKFIQDEARKKSAELGAERGSFPNFEKSIHAKKYKTLRNATCTTIAPTGSISLIAGVSSGIEPFFAISYIREVLEGTKLLEVSPVFIEQAKEKGIYSKQLMLKIAKQGSVQDIKEVPRDMKKTFVTSFDINPEWHVKLQAAFQKFTDNGVSKTVNLPNNATIEDIKKIYLLAWKMKCKGVTVYRYGSKQKQVLYKGKKAETEHIIAEEEFSGGCPDLECAF